MVALILRMSDWVLLPKGSRVSQTKVRNMQEFASLSGISRPTVSRYFFDPSSVRASTRERIEQALERYDYRPNVYAVNQNRRLTKSIGIMVPYLADPFFGEIARTIERLCIDAGFSPILFSSHGEQALESENLQSLAALKPAGALIAPLGRTSDRRALEQFCADVPTILFDSNIEGIGEGFVGSDNQRSIAQIVTYLCSTGQPPCFLEGRTAPNPNANRRRMSYLACMERLGQTPHIIKAEGEGWEFEGIGYRAGILAFERGAFPTDTVLCSNDRLAIGLLAAAYEKGLRVGREEGCLLRVAGHDDHPFSRYTCPPLTTISQDYTAIATRSVEMMVGLFAQDDGVLKARSETVFDGRLVVRASA